MANNGIVRSAHQAFNASQFEEAITLYQQASELIGADFFHANIALCKKRGNINKSSDLFKKSLIGKLDQNSDSIYEFISLLGKIDLKWKEKKAEDAATILSSIDSETKLTREYCESISIEQLLLLSKAENEKNAAICFKFWSSVLADNLNGFLEDASGNLVENDIASALVHDFFEVGLHFKSEGFSEEALKAFKIATKYRKEEKWLRSLFWQAYKKFDVQVARKALEEIKTLEIKTKSNEWLAYAENKLASISAGFEEIISALSKRSERSYKATPKKIAYFLHNSLPYSSGGYATRAHGMATGLQENGFKVLCVSRPGFPLDTPGDHAGRELSAFDEIDGVEYHRIFGPLRVNISGNLYMLQSAQAIEEFLIKHKVDLVMAASNHLTAIPAGIAARRLGLPYLYEVRGFWEVTRVSREPEYESTLQYLVQVRNETVASIHADRVFTLTAPMLEELVKRGVPAQKITLLPNSCDPSRFTPRSRDIQLAQKLGIPDDVPVIGYIGSFVQYEGLENLAQACSYLIQRGIDFRLLLVGSENASGSERGPITQEIQLIANESGLADKLIMPGRVPHELVEAYYSLIDIAPFPRKPQPVTEMVSPMKPLEALAMEKAVVVSSVRALTEMIIDDKTGLVFKKGDIEDLADKLQLLISDPILRLRLGKAGRKWVETERTWRKTAFLASKDISKSTC
jgi:glycosyltransferase involved in cell wall biosynthesis